MLSVALAGLAGIWALALVTWLASLIKRDVSIVDSVWSLLFVAAALTYAWLPEEVGPRATLVLWMVGIWALRLCAYLTWRNWGQEEDYRYREIRANNQPNFQLKSLYLVFGLQGFLAWIVSWSLLAAITSHDGINFLDYVGLLLWAVGMAFETVGDYQLARFKADPANRGRVMDQGLWRYTRHPNYFGEACIWWGFFLMALAAGGWWSAVSPVLMTILLLRVSGVSLLERDMGKRRPDYVDYVQRTNAFFPGPPRTV